MTAGASGAAMRVDPAIVAAFPFFIACDEQGWIQSVGAALAKLDPAAVGARFEDRFTIVRPAAHRTVMALASTPRAMVLLRTRDGLSLRGQALRCEGGVLFVGSPLFEAVEDVRKFGLTVSDFAAHDAAIDYVVLLDQVRAQLRESNELAARLSAEIRAAERLRDEANEATARALEAGRVKEEFFASMSHELRTPLTTILATNQLLFADGLSSEQREHVVAQQKAAESLLALIHSVLDLAKLRSGRFDLTPEPFEPRWVIDEAVAALREPASRRSLMLEWTASDDVPSTVRGDPVRFRQVVTNLVSNALKFTERGGVLVRLTLGAREGERVALRLSVIDTGRGIAPEALAKLFRPFVQAHDERREGLGGTGLGLSICRQIAELMGGTTGATSTLGVGSTFWFEGGFEQTTERSARRAVPFGPIASRKSASVPRDEGSAAATRGPERASPPLVLVVEDNAVNRKLLALLVESLGYLVDTAVDGRAALAALAYGDYRAVLMDCNMPEMDGFAATRALRASSGASSQTPVIAVTAHALEGDRQRCLDAGMNDYLTKPVSRLALLEALSRWAPIHAEPGATPLLVGGAVRAGESIAPGAAAVDRAVLGALRAMRPPGEPDLVAEVFALFEVDARAHAATMIAAANARDSAALRAAAHGLRGAAASVGASKVERLCRWLERYAREDEDWSLRRDLALAIEREVERALADLAAYTSA